MSVLNPARMPLMHPILEWLRDNPNSSSAAIALGLGADHRDVQRWICELALRDAIDQSGSEARSGGRRPAPLYVVKGHDPDHRALFRKMIGEATHVTVEKTLFDRTLRLVSVTAMALRVADDEKSRLDARLAEALERTAAQLDKCNNSHLRRNGAI